MKKRKTIFSKTDIEDLIHDLCKLYPKLYFENISNLAQGKAYFLQLDLLVRSELFRTTLHEMADSITKLSRNEQNEFLGFMKTHNINVKTKFHELLLGNYFQKLGFEMQYQPKFINLNPDWMINDSEGKAIVEVFTLNEYDDYNDERVFRLFFTKKIKIIEEHYNLHFDFNWSRFNLNESFCDSNLVKVIDSISLDIQNKLKKNKFEPNSHFDTLYGLEVILSSIGLNQKVIGGGYRSPRMINRFEEKYDKYKDLATQMKMPLILVCTSDCIARSNCDPFKNIIFGIDDSSFSPRKEGVINPKNKMPEISGFILFDYNLLSSQFDITYVPNPNATYPIELKINKKCNKKHNESIGWFL